MLQDFRLKVFLEVASLKSFTKAAEALDVSQPAGSQNISELEKGLGVRLFQRSRGETLLTPEGEVFSGYARKILATASEAELMFSNLDSFHIKFYVTDELLKTLVHDAMKDFIAAHQDVSVMFTSDIHDADVHVGAVRTDDSDLSLCFRLVYKPTQAFAVTKTCAVLKNILGF